MPPGVAWASTGLLLCWPSLARQPEPIRHDAAGKTGWEKVYQNRSTKSPQNATRTLSSWLVDTNNRGGVAPAPGIPSNPFPPCSAAHRRDDAWQLITWARSIHADQKDVGSTVGRVDGCNGDGWDRSEEWDQVGPWAEALGGEGR